MQVNPENLAREIVKQYKELPVDRRLIVVIAGPPGSGKSTLAYPLTDALNALLLHHPPAHPSHIEQPASSNLAEPSSHQGEGDEVAVCVGLDGWHCSRKELDGFEDPKEAHWRRGAAFTFNLPAYTTFLQQLRLPLSPTPPASIPFPTFDHALKDPTWSPSPILPRHRIVLIEGLYTLLDDPGWRECAEEADLKVWVDVDEAVARERVIKRNWEAGIVDSLEKCAERVDASDMVNGVHVRTKLVPPAYVVTSIDGQPFSADTFQAA
ncbi:hypothetical protein IAT38_002761 [Cryptococcus sp. DSM 104549]